MNDPERCIDSARIYEGRIINLRVDQVELSEGRSTKREVVEHRGAAAIVPVLNGKEVVLVRQYRYAIDSELLEIPAGTLDPGEDPETCARRELTEETGYVAGELMKFMECLVAPGYSTEKIHFYLARNLQLSQMNTEEDERIQLEVIPFVAALDKIGRGEIRDAKTISALYRAAELL